MSKLKKGKVLGIAAACLLVASLVGAGVLPAPTTLAQEVPSVSIVPEAQDVEAGETFTIDVWVDAAGRDLHTISVDVQYDSDAMTTSVEDVTTNNLLGEGQFTLAKWVTEVDGVGTVRQEIVVLGREQANVNGSAMSIEFTMDAAAEPGDYDLTISRAVLANLEGVFEDTETNDGTVTIPGAPPPEGPSVSIDPETRDVVAGNSFTIDVLVDADGNDLMGIDVEVEYDAGAMTTSRGQITAYNLLDAPEWGVIGPRVPDGKVRYALVNVEAQADVEGLLMTIEFAVNEDAVPDDYALTIALADLADENGVKLPDVTRNDGVVTVLSAEPEPFEDTFSEYLARRDRAYICRIPAEATNLAIDLTTAASPGPDMDLELYDGDILVIGYRGEISRAPGGTYEDDEFGYSGYRGGVEFITADGPLGQAYDLMVYAYQAGTYTVDVYYEIPVGVDVTPPTISIDVPATVSLGDEVTITVSATDPSGVFMVSFWVYPEEYPEGWDDGYPVAGVTTFTDEGSLTFVPGWAGTYTVEAYAMDNANNMSEETDTFVVLE